VGVHPKGWVNGWDALNEVMGAANINKSAYLEIFSITFFLLPTSTAPDTGMGAAD